MSRSSEKTSRSTANEAIRTALLDAAKSELRAGAFRLSGRGHEPRVTLNRSLAAIVRGLGLPSVIIAGYGANRYYPRRVFETAAKLLRQRKFGALILFWDDMGQASRAEDE